jgi:hypothetical protein
MQGLLTANFQTRVIRQHWPIGLSTSAAAWGTQIITAKTRAGFR